MVSLKIRRIYVNGFGIHHVRTLQLDVDAQATVFYGNNEAGKSTLMSFIRAMLFGFPKRSNKLERYEPLSGGLHGGALTILDHDGTEIRIERYEKNSSLKLLFPDGAVAGEAALQSLLGGLTAELYKNLFAFSLSELQRMDTLHAEEISGFLFNAGMGISGGMMAQAERKLMQQMELLYKQQGSKQAINEQLRILEQSELELRRSKERSGQYHHWQVELAQLETMIEDDELELIQYRTKLDWFNKCLKSRDSWIQLLEIESELRVLPEFAEFPEDLLSRFEKAQEDLERVNGELLSLQQEQASANELWNGLTMNEQLIERRAELEQLLEAAAVHAATLISIADNRAEQDGYQAEVQRYLRLISPDWSVEQMQQFPLSIHHREQVNRMTERFNHISSSRQTRSIEREHVEEQVEQHRSSKQDQQMKRNEISWRMESNFATLTMMDREQLRASESEIQKLWEHIRELASDLNHLEQRVADAIRNEQLLRSRRASEQQRVSRAQPQNWTLRLLATAVTVALPLWIILGLDSWMTGITIAALLGLFMTFFWLQKVNPKARPEPEDSLYVEARMHREQLEKEAKRLRVQWMERCVLLSTKLRMYMPDLPDDAGRFEAAVGRSWTDDRQDGGVKPSIQLLEQWVDSFVQYINQYKQVDDELSSADIQLRMSVQALDVLGQRLTTIIDNESKEQQLEADLTQEWQQWLSSYQLPHNLSVESMNIMFQYAEAGLQLLDQTKRLQNKLIVQEESQQAFERVATMFLRQQGVDIPLSVTHIVYELKKLKELLEGQVTIQDNRRRIEQQIKELDHREQLCANRVTNVQEKLHDLLTAARASDEDELRRLVKLHARRTELGQSKRHHEVVIFTWVKEEQQQQLFHTLEQLDAAQIKQQLDMLNEAVVQLENRLNESKDQRGGLRKEMDNLQSGSQHAELLQRHQEHIAEFQQLAARWAELALSGKLIRQAKEIYERERQPGVLRRASQYMRTITDGQLVRVVSRIGEKTIFVERENGEQLDSTLLSRGTAEQLYLAMRFALADEYSKTVALPLIMDDIFVNFDADRLSRTLSVLADVATRHQIIIFTCHDHIRHALQVHLPRVQIIELEG